MNGPPVGPVTVPAELEPSPQSIVAVKSAVVACELASARLSTLPLKDVEETGEVAQVDASAASTTFAAEFAVAVLLVSSTPVTRTVPASVPPSPSVCVPD